MIAKPPDPGQDQAYVALSRALYRAQGEGSSAGTEDVRERLIEFVAQMRTDERTMIPLGEPHLGSLSGWRRRMKYALFRTGRFATRRYDRLLGDHAELTVRLAERVLELEHEVEALRDRLGAGDSEAHPEAGP
jgi:hypothetical protein